MNVLCAEFSKMAVLRQNKLIAVVNMMITPVGSPDDSPFDPTGKWPMIGRTGFFYVHDDMHTVRDATEEEVEYAESGVIYEKSPSLQMVNFSLMEKLVFEDWSLERLADHYQISKDQVITRVAWVRYAMDSILHAKSFERTWRGFVQQANGSKPMYEFFRNHKRIFRVYFELAKSYQYSEIVLYAMRAAENVPLTPEDDEEEIPQEVIELGKMIKASGNKVDFNAIFDQFATV